MTPFYWPGGPDVEGDSEVALAAYREQYPDDYPTPTDAIVLASEGMSEAAINRATE